MYILAVSSLLKKGFTKTLDFTCSIRRKQNCLLENYECIVFNCTDTSILNPENFISTCNFKLLSRIVNKELHRLDQSFPV